MLLHTDYRYGSLERRTEHGGRRTEDGTQLKFGQTRPPCLFVWLGFSLGDSVSRECFILHAYNGMVTVHPEMDNAIHSD